MNCTAWSINISAAEIDCHNNVALGVTVCNLPLTNKKPSHRSRCSTYTENDVKKHPTATFELGRLLPQHSWSRYSCVPTILNDYPMLPPLVSSARRSSRRRKGRSQWRSAATETPRMSILEYDGLQITSMGCRMSPASCGRPAHCGLLAALSWISPRGLPSRAGGALVPFCRYQPVTWRPGKFQASRPLPVPVHFPSPSRFSSGPFLFLRSCLPLFYFAFFLILHVSLLPFALRPCVSSSSAGSSSPL